MEDLAARLRRAREERGLPLKDIAGRTKISVAALEMLERGDFEKMPGGIFSRAFVRAYALEIGLDPDPVVEEFLEEVRKLEQEAAARRAVRPEVTADDREFLARQRRALRILRLVALGLVTILIVFLAVQVPRWWRRADATNAAALDPAPSATPAAPQTSGSGAFAPPPVAATPPPVPVTTTAGITVAIEITGECWVRALTDGKVAFARVFRAGDRESLIAEKEVVLELGNAGMLLWTINGQRAKSVGRAGATARVRLTPENVAEYLQAPGEGGDAR